MLHHLLAECVVLLLDKSDDLIELMGYSPIFVKKTKIQKDAEVKNDSDVVMQNLNLVSPQNSFKATSTKAE